MKKIVMVIMALMVIGNARVRVRSSEFSEGVKISSSSSSMIKASTSIGSNTLYILPYTPSSSCRSKRGLSLKFEDGTIFDYPNITASISTGYGTFFHTSYLALDDELVNKLITTRLTNIKIGDTELNVPSGYARRLMRDTKDVYDTWILYQH